MLPWLNPNALDFPPPDSALTDPDGLLAAGGDLSTERLIAAYKTGIFPWYSEDQPILWWSPDPRCALKPGAVHSSRSLKKFIRKTALTLTFDNAFERVISHCSRLESEEGTWITDEMYEAYLQLHDLGVAHSIEVSIDDELVGGLYGLAIGRCFFGESMFSVRPNASKVAFSALCRQLQRWNYSLVDCQVENSHLLSMGATSLPRQEFLSILKDNVDQQANHDRWEFDLDILNAI
jgi:leucyl/phenylalanyl-tRNA--protein transferase